MPIATTLQECKKNISLQECNDKVLSLQECKKFSAEEDDTCQKYPVGDSRSGKEMAMKFFCPACGGPNEAHSENERIRCAWCGTVISLRAAVISENHASPEGRSANRGTEASLKPEAGLVNQETEASPKPGNGPVNRGAEALPKPEAGVINPGGDSLLKPGADLPAGTVSVETAAAASDAAKASIDAAAAILEAAKKSGANLDPEWTAGILAEAAKAASTAAAAAAAAKAAEEAAAAAAAEKAAMPGMPVESQTKAQPVLSGDSRPAGMAQAAAGTAQAEAGAVQTAAGGGLQTRGTAAAQNGAAGGVQTAAGGGLQTRGSAAAQNRTAGAAQAAAGPRYEWRKFADNKTGIVLAKAIVPESFSSGGNLLQAWQSDLVPFTASFQASSPDRRILFSTTSGEIFIWYLNPLIRSFAKKTPNVILSSFREFIEPDEYLHQYAQRMAGMPLTPTARAKLPSAYGKDLAGERQRLLQYIEEHMINISVRETISTCYCDAFLYRYEGVANGRRIVVLAGCDYKGTESYDANGGPAGMGLLSMGLQGGLLGQFMRNKTEKTSGYTGGGYRGNGPIVSPTGVGAGNIPFGHGKEHGKQVDLINWGSERLYFMAAPIEAEKAATEAFLRFVGSITPDPALWKQRSLLVEQKHQSRILEAQQLHSQAVQMQIQAQQRQRELQRQIQANNEEISRGIMDSWEKRSASQSRISENWSQAIRGVDTYSTPSGRTVEASVSADHVYQNRYGDTIEVSGPALDDELVTSLDWTKLNREN